MAADRKRMMHGVGSSGYNLRSRKSPFMNDPDVKNTKETLAANTFLSSLKMAAERKRVMHGVGSSRYNLRSRKSPFINDPDVKNTKETLAANTFLSYLQMAAERKRVMHGVGSSRYNLRSRKFPFINDTKELVSVKTQYRKTEQQQKCDICFDYKKDSDMFKGSKCKHPFCSDCMSKHAAAKIQQNNLKVNCPDPNCGVELKPKDLQAILPQQVFDRWESARCESLIPVKNKIYCPYKDCSVLMVNDGGKVVTSAECPSCHRLFCAQCLVPWHAGMKCKEFNRKSIMSEEEKDSERKILELAETKKWQRCPKCNIYVEKIHGCEHMICRCGCHFCYHCGKDWKFSHLCQTNDDGVISLAVMFVLLSTIFVFVVLGICQAEQAG